MDNPSVQTAAQSKPKRRRRKWPWITLGIVVILPLFLLGYSGLWNIPVISAVFGTNKPIDLGVEVSQAAYERAMADNPMTFVGDTSAWYGMSVKKYSGTVRIDDEHSSAEVSSFINLGIGGHRYARDIQVKFRPGGMELSAFVVPKIKAPVYADIDVVRTANKSVAITVKRAKVGRLTVPAGYYDDISRIASEWINDRIAEVPGASIDVLEYRENAAYLKGTLPKTVEQVAGQEYTILGQDLRSL